MSHVRPTVVADPDRVDCVVSHARRHVHPILFRDRKVSGAVFHSLLPFASSSTRCTSVPAFLLLSSVAKISELELSRRPERDRRGRARATHGLHEDRDIVTIMLLLLLGAVAYEEDWDRRSLVQKLDASQMQTAIMKHDKVRTID